MVRQHDPARADPDAFGAAGDMSDYDGGRSAGNAGEVVMFRQPVAMVAPFLSVPREVECVAKSECCVAAFDDRREIEQGKIFHRAVYSTAGDGSVTFLPEVQIRPI